MNLFRIAWRYALRRPARLALQLFSLALGLALVDLLWLAEREASRWLSSQTQGVALVVGAKGSPLQLVLSTLFHLDWPTGNIPLQEAERLAASPLVADAWPMALGDSYRGWRLVGTDTAYLRAFPGTGLAAGRLWEAPFEVVAGADAADALGLKIGDALYAGHGLEAGGHDHEDRPYRVVGILRPHRSALDRVLLCGVASVWESHHASWPASDSLGRLGLPLRPGAEITAMLLRFRNPIGAIRMLPYVNGETRLQAASPSFEANRLLALAKPALGGLRALGWALALGGVGGLWLAMAGAIDEQRYDLAVMRALGASRGQVMGVVWMQGMLLAVVSVAAGTLLAHAALSVGAWAWGLPWEAAWDGGELLALLAVCAGAGGVALLPAWALYRKPLADALL